MANLATLKAALNAAVYQNNQNAITGESLNTILTKIIDTLGAGYRYAGVATPSANPGTIDNRVFYLATAAGTYTNFGGTVLDGKALHVFIYDTTWHNVTLDVPTTAALAVQKGSGTNSVEGKDAKAGATGVGSVCLGSTDSAGAELGAELLASGPGSIVVGCAETDGDPDSVARLSATGSGASASGYTYGESVAAEIIASEEGAHAEGWVYASSVDSRIEASGSGAHAEGYAVNDYILASGSGAHAEGINTKATGYGAHAEGMKTRAQNNAEHASGKYNATHFGNTDGANTLFSIGCGNNDNDRMNAVEVMQNGDAYLKGVGGYDGTNPASQDVGSLEAILNPLIFFVSPPSDPNVPIDNLRNWMNQPIVVSGSGYAYTKLIDAQQQASIYSQYLQSLLSIWGITPDLGNCVYIGVDGSAVFNSGNFVRGQFCCIYDDAPNDNYYFIEMSI